MAGTHFAKAIRDTINALIDGAALTVLIDGVATPVKRLTNPPRGLGRDDRELPYIYVFVSGETITPATLTTLQRSPTIEFIIVAKGPGDPHDQLDEIQMKLEVAMFQSTALAALCHDLYPAFWSVGQEQGETIFAARRLTYQATTEITRNDPSI